jgi:3'-phosphoadenosine 5'-phosphosulfate sulfotransferase (PAPS reductase)/FAD synthetase
MQAWSLEHKIRVTQTRIIEWYQKWDGQVYVSFSGGKDSTVLLDLVRRIYPDVPAVFVDTGLEYPEVRNHVKAMDNVVWLKPKMTFKEVILKYGYPLISKEVSQKIYEARKTPCGACAARFNDNSPHNQKYGKRYSMSKWTWLRDSDIPISHMCCTVMKKNPAKKYEKQSGRKPIVGTMACESNMRKTVWLHNGCNAFSAKRPISSPLSFWTEQDVLEYIVKYIEPKYHKAWDEACNSHGSVRRKARKFLKRHNYTKTGIATVYGEIKIDPISGKYYTTKCDRTGCVFCMFGVHLEKEPNRFQRLKVTHPKLWEYCMKPVENGGLGIRKVLEFIGVKVE